ncbi:MAG TPA: dihydrolipoamide acetyltransferase family protein [Sphingobacteriaceae bacterium]|nr:dihydrolipoamide acetyltransferase family protein [Sphingobacteriaceae bacterium]
MAQHQLILPKMGESVSEATIIKWLKQPGDRIEEDEPVLEIATDKVDSDVPSPVAGVLKEQLFTEDSVVQVGQVLAIIATEGSEADPIVQPESIPYVPSDVQSDSSIATTSAKEPISESESKPASSGLEKGSRFYSPLVKSIAAEEGISMEELEAIHGTGKENRVTKQDVLDYLENRQAKGSMSEQKAPVEATTQQTTSVAASAVPTSQTAPVEKTHTIPVSQGSDEIIEMDRMRRLIADHMVASLQTSPHVCSFVEADVTNLVNWRNKIKSAYEKREGEKITFTPIFIEAVSKALKDFPMVNVSVDGYNIIKKKNINIGMATALPSGNLIVPVIRNADQLSLVGLSKSVNDLANRARSNKLKPDDTQGGTFTVTNVGAFGNITGTPIINQPQVAIMAVGTITKKPAVLETEHGDVIAIRHKMVLSLSYDHRVVDGSLGGRFVKRVADYLEAWDVDREI